MSAHSLKIKILGCGTSTGVPVPGCPCAVCTSRHPRNKRLRTAAALETPSGKVILIDASTDMRQQALEHDIRRVDAVLLTHAHADHILGIDDLRVFNFVTQRRIPLFGSSVTLSEVRRIFSYIFTPDPHYEGGLLAQLDTVEVAPFTQFQVEDISVMPFTLLHGRMPILGYRVGAFAYATDCKSIPDAALDVLRDLDVLILDGLRYEPHRSHMTIPEAVQAAQRIAAKRTYLTHMTHSVDYESVNAKLPHSIELAYDGLELFIPWP